MIPRSTGIETRRKVLLVDDDAVSLELMALLLAHEGHQVLRAENAGAALELLAVETAGRPDVLLVDLQMPGVSGGQLAERIRALEGPGPLLLAMSATEVKRRQLLDFDGFLLKPLALDDLRRALRPKNRGRKPGVRITHPGAGAGAHCGVGYRPAAAASANGAAIDTAVVDSAVVEKLLTMMPVESLYHVVAACIADTRGCVEALETQIRAGDSTGVRHYAHRMKGAASMIGATRLARLAAGLEMGGTREAATHGALQDLLSACSELERMLLAGKFKKT